jgi:iron complex outermembrane receptor protein
MNRMKRRQLSLAVAKALGAGAVIGLALPVANAQQAPVEKIRKIEVTGSRIPLQTLESESPVNIISAQDIAYTGLTSTSEILNQLPAAFADLGSNEANGATGTATVNLRGLGASRTLVLIDGRRLPAGDPQSYPTDLNWIPAPLVQRVDVLTGGASSIYGSDAVAGVVNFIMNDHFEGVQFSWNGNWYQHDQHDTSGVSSAVAARAETNPAQFHVPGNVHPSLQAQDFSFVLGSNFAGGKGNATVYFEWKKQQPVTEATRDFSACAAGLNDEGTDFNCGGSSTSYPGRFFNLANGKSFTIADAAGNVRPFNSANDQYNFQPSNYFQVPDERYIANFFAHYDVFPSVRVYTEFDFMDEKTVLQIAPSGAFFGTGPVQETLYDNNPLLSQSFKDAMGIPPGGSADMFIGRRNVEGGGRQDTPEHTDYRIVIGAKGDVLDGKWNYDAWWQSGKVILSDTYLHDLSTARVLNALTVVSDPNTGQPVCASVLSGTDPACVPWDIFHIGGVTQAALNYLQTPGFKSGYTFQNVVGLHVDSDLGEAYGWKLPGAKNGVGFAAGAEMRTEKVNLDVDEFFAVPLGTGQGGPTLPLNGQYTVREFFGEVRVPILDDQPWAQALNFNASYRYSSYSTGPNTNTYGLGAEWAPVKSARLRGTYQKATRAPNVIELFQAQGFNLFNLSADPCGPSKTATLAQCLQSGLPAGQYGNEILDSPAGQYNYLQGGNPALQPEDSKSYTLGLVLTNPIANLSGTLDYWNIKVTNVVGVAPPSQTLSQCLNNNQNCNLVHRDPTLGALWVGTGYVSGLNQNLGSYKTDGIDLTLNYLYPFEKYGSLGFNFIGTWVNQFIVEPVPGAGSYDCAGLFGNTCTPAVPTWRSNLMVVWNSPWNFNVGGRWRYTSAVDLDSCDSSVQPFAGTDCPPKNAQLGVREYLDLFGQWNINKNFTLRAGVNNVFDRDPPISENGIGQLPFWNGNTFPQAYDWQGRNLFLNVTAKF